MKVEAVPRTTRPSSVIAMNRAVERLPTLDRVTYIVQPDAVPRSAAIAYIITR